MKIVYISTSIIPSKSANSVHVMKMSQAFAQLGHKVTLIGIGKENKIDENISSAYNFYNVDKCFDLRIIKYLKIKGKSLVYAFSAVVNVLRIRPDLVYGRSLTGCALTSFLGFPTFLEVHIPISFYGRLEAFFFRQLNKQKNFRKLVVISDALKRIYLKEGMLRSDLPLQVACDGADEVTCFSKVDNWLGRQNILQVGYVGHLYKGKGIEIIEKIAHKMVNVDFHIIGGLDEDIDYWKNRAFSSNIFFHGFVEQNRISEYINRLDICLLPNQKVVNTYNNQGIKYNIGDFTSPLKMFEYMAHKKAIVASRIPVLQEVLNKTNSILVGCNNYEEWIEAINKLQDKKQRERIAIKAFNDFVSKYSWQKRCQNILNYEK